MALIICEGPTMMNSMHRSSRTPGAQRRIVSSVVACLAIVLLSSAARAGSTVLQFGQTNPSDVVTASESGGVTMLSTGGNSDGGGVSIPVVITNFLGVPGVSIPAFETYVNVTSTGTASTFLGQAFQGFTGTIEITSGIGGTGSNFLTATFPDTANPGTFSGTLGGTQAQLSATAPPQTLQLSSDFATFLGAAVDDHRVLERVARFRDHVRLNRPLHSSEHWDLRRSGGPRARDVRNGLHGDTDRWLCDSDLPS